MFRLARGVRTRLHLVTFGVAFFFLFLSVNLKLGFNGNLSPKTLQDSGGSGKEKLWFMTEGTLFPSTSNASGPPSPPSLWYNPVTSNQDRIVEQLLFGNDDPLNYAHLAAHFEASTTEKAPAGTSKAPRILNISTLRRPSRLEKLKSIYLAEGFSGWNRQVRQGRHLFLEQRCPISTCRLTANPAHASSADLILFKYSAGSGRAHPPGQLWLSYVLESPHHSEAQYTSGFNLTATYRHDSDVVAPYGKWVYFDDAIRTMPQADNYAAGKTKKVAMFVSNCFAQNDRLEYAKQLGNYISVDIYGACGNLSCPRNQQSNCSAMLSRDYKFYLAFENSNCRDYITEKFFDNGLRNKILPIVMGAHPNDYQRAAPEKSYLHVDDFPSPKDLAEYLVKLDANDALYNEYFEWKGTGQFVDTFFFCRLCAITHYAQSYPKVPGNYKNLGEWWAGDNVCTKGRWDACPDIFAAEIN